MLRFVKTPRVGVVSKMFLVCLVLLISISDSLSSASEIVNNRLNYLLNFIRESIASYNFKDAIIYSSNEISSKHLLDFHPSFSKIFKGTYILVENRKSFAVTKLRHVVNVISLISFVFYESLTDDILNIANQSLRGLHTSPIVFISLKAYCNESEVENALRFAWKMSWLNCVVVCQSTEETAHIFNYNHFPEFIVQNVTSIPVNRLFVQYKDNYRLNCKGLKVNSSFVQSIPRAFKYKDMKGQVKISGFGAEILMEFMRYSNCTNVEVTLNVTTSVNEAISEAFEQNAAEISMLPLTVYNRTAYDSSYPIKPVWYCMVAPVAKEISPFMYLVHSFDINVWVIYIAVVIYTSSAFYIGFRMLSRRVDFGDGFCYVIRTIVGLPSSSIIHKNVYKNWKLSLIDIQIRIFGFVMTNLYLAFTTSFLTRTVYQHPVNTIEEAIQNDLHILSLKFRTDFIFKSAKLPAEFKRLFVDTDYKTWNMHVNHFNRSYAYVLNQDKWEELSEQQKFLRQAYFKKTDVCFAENLVSFVMQPNSFLEYPLQHFIIRIHQNGLYHHWVSETFDKLVFARELNRLVDEFSGPVLLRLNHLMTLQVLWCVGLSVGFLIFILELIIRYFDYKKFLKYCIRIKNNLMTLMQCA